MQSFGALAGGALQLVEVGCLSVKLPVKLGHLGGDGWAVAYWAPWSNHLPRQVWHKCVRPLLDAALPNLLEPIGSDSNHGPSTATCMTLDIPRTATVAYLFAAAASVEDRCVAEQLCSWLRTLTKCEDGAMWIPEGRDWSASCTAQLLFGLSWLRGATLKPFSCICGGNQLTGIDGARVLRAEAHTEGLLICIESSGRDKITLCTNFKIKEARQISGSHMRCHISSSQSCAHASSCVCSAELELGGMTTMCFVSQ